MKPAKKKDELVVFILTHGRPDRVYTERTLRRCGYTRRIVYVVDDEDAALPEYRKRYGKDVVVFSKAKIAKTFDEGDLAPDRRSIVYARNASFGIARALGIKYFIQLDDDYTNFGYRFDSERKYNYGTIYNLDRVFDLLLAFYKSIPAKAIAVAQGGDFIGGSKSPFAEIIKLYRKCMNSFICSTERPFVFLGRINEDVNTYVRLGSVGELFFTIPNMKLDQVQTQTNAGGMAELYRDSGTYQKSFFSVMYNPSCVKIMTMNSKFKRLHHGIHWEAAVPRIVNEKYKK